MNTDKKTRIDTDKNIDEDQERLLKYKALAVAFSYPDEDFFAFFPGLSCEREKLIAEYDRLFRAEAIWLYAAEHLSENEFQRVHHLADIMGFYRAFGLEPDKDRADSLACQLEFMHYLIYKAQRAMEFEDKEKAAVCLEAQKKFLAEYLYPGLLKIRGAIISKDKDSFYAQAAQECLKFIESEQGAPVA